MRSLISTELLKVRTTRAAYVAGGIVALITLVLPVLGALLAGSGDIEPLQPADLAGALRAPVALAGGAVLLVGLLSAAGEFRHHTVLTTRLGEPRPTRILLAKLVTMAGLGLATGVVMTVTTLVEAFAVFRVEGVAYEPMHHGVVRVALAIPLVLALHGVIGVAIGSLLRNTAAAVGITLVWAFVVEGVVPVVTRQPTMANWLPTGLLRQALETSTAQGQPTPAVAGAIIVVVVAALVAATAVLDSRREL